MKRLNIRFSGFLMSQLIIALSEKKIYHMLLR